ncbi:MAG: pitrilysin family protein [Alphaproteobacteria bacterium]
MNRRGRIIICLAAALLLAGPVVAQATAQKEIVKTEAPARKKIFNAETFKLDNGLEIVVIPNHRAPVITHMVWYKVGAADEDHGVSGVAHFLEHLMFKGSEGLKPGEFSHKIRALGGNDNAFTSQDYTAYHQSISVDHLETVMKMEAGRMRGLNSPVEQVTSENKVILEERRERTDNDPHARFSEQMNAALYINHPYGNPVIGWADEMAALTWETCKNFYDKWYGPNNAILVVSGDVTGQQIYGLAKKIYGPLEPVPLPARTRAKIPPLEASVTLRLEDKIVRQAWVQKVFIAPSYRQNSKESLALQVLEELMAGGPTSRLYKALVVEQKIATSAGLSYQGSSWDDADLDLYASPLPGQKPEDVITALDEQIRLLIKNGIPEAELKEALTRMQAEAVYARDSLSGPAMIFGYSLATGSSVDDVEYWPYNIAAVTANEIIAVAKKYLDPDNIEKRPAVTGYLLPEQAPQPAPEESALEKRAAP